MLANNKMAMFAPRLHDDTLRYSARSIECREAKRFICNSLGMFLEILANNFVACKLDWIVINS